MMFWDVAVMLVTVVDRLADFGKGVDDKPRLQDKGRYAVDKRVYDRA